MDYKLICIDMDGTLLNSEHKVSEISKDTLRKAQNSGIYIVISTGRMYADAKAFSNLIGIKAPIIASNGAIIKEKNSEEEIYKSVLDENLVFRLLDIISKYKLKPIFYTPHKAYCGSLLSVISLYRLKLKGVFKDIKFEYVGTLKKWRKIFKIENDNIIKCEIMKIDKTMADKLRIELKAMDKFEIASSTKDNLEITCKGVSKGRAVEILSLLYNIEREKVIAIGDSENDLSMIEFAGMGVAMGNAIKKVKEKADFITESNDNEGVAKAIDKFVLRTCKNI